MLAGDTVTLEHERHQIANVFCDEDDRNWGAVVASLGDGEDDCLYSTVNCRLVLLDEHEFTEEMYQYGKDNLIKVNIFIR